MGIRREYHILLKYVCLFDAPLSQTFFFSSFCLDRFHLFYKSQCTVSVSYKVSNIHKHVLKNNLSFTKFRQHQQLRYTIFSITLFSFSFSSLSSQFFTETISHYSSKFSRILAVTLQPNLTHNLSQFHGSLCLSD